MNKKTKATIVFLGNFEEGILSLSRLIREGYYVPLCLGDKRSASLKEFCDVNNINYVNGSIVKDIEFLKILEYYKPDLLISNNFMYLLPKSVLDKYKAINLHSSLLPNYKGRYSILQTILAGEQSAGYTIHYMTPEMDSGNILLKKEIPLDDNQTSVDVMKTLINFQPNDIIKATELALSDFKGVAMSGNGKTLNIENYRELLIGIDTLEECSRKLRAFVKPYPLAYIKLSGLKFYIHKALYSNGNKMDNSVKIKLKDGCIYISEVSIHGEVGFDAYSLLHNMKLNLEHLQ